MNASDMLQQLDGDVSSSPSDAQSSSHTPGRLVADIVETDHDGLLILSHAHTPSHRRVLFINSYGGRLTWQQVKKRSIPSHHLWGCLELARMGYEVGIADPLSHFDYRRHPLPHDLRLFGTIRSWLRPDDLVYCGHTLLFWLPLLRRLGLLKVPLVSLLYARDDLNFAGAHAGIIALNPAAASHARRLAPKVKVAELGWGVDRTFFPNLTYSPHFLLSCGITYRDHQTLSDAAAQSRVRVRVICPERPQGISWPDNVDVYESGKGYNIVNEKSITFDQLMHQYYAKAAGALVITKRDDNERGACGFTNLLESMAMGRPVILTRTGALATEIDVERDRCGLHVPPGDVDALARAMSSLAADPARAAALGQAGRDLCEARYDIRRYAEQLHTFFESL
jgi:glycosyltransferase involved in cell wall biosynthesis